MLEGVPNDNSPQKKKVTTYLQRQWKRHISKEKSQTNQTLR